MPYDIYEHVHRFAAWAASTAASQKGHRFSVQDGQRIIEQAGLKGFLCNHESLPHETKAVDQWHQELRTKVKEIARSVAPQANFNDGIAAKLINVYFKAGLVTVANCDNRVVAALHPPIDSQLLKGLRESDERSDLPSSQERARFWKSKERTGSGWSSFSSESYQEVIDKIREKLGTEKPLWMIEEHWRGHQ